MASLRYPYGYLPGHSVIRPLVKAVAINLLNGKDAEFIGIVDTGADQTALSDELIDILEIDDQLLPWAPIGGAEGFADCMSCDCVKIAFLEEVSLERYFPNGAGAVPLHFTDGPFNLLGQQSFLDKVISSFDGPRQEVSIHF